MSIIMEIPLWQLRKKIVVPWNVYDRMELWVCKKLCMWYGNYTLLEHYYYILFNFWTRDAYNFARGTRTETTNQSMLQFRWKNSTNQTRVIILLVNSDSYRTFRSKEQIVLGNRVRSTCGLQTRRKFHQETLGNIEHT